MRPVRTVAVYFFVIFLGSALLAPWFYKAVHGLSVMVPALNPLAQVSFPRYFSRTLMLLGVFGLWPLARKLGIQSWPDLGLKKTVNWWSDLAKGFLCGFGSLACVALVAVIFGARRFDSAHTVSEVLRHFGNAGLAAIVVSFIEEICFRGLLFGGLRRSLGWPTALGVSSVIYAGLHFLQRTKFEGAVDWSTGFVVLGLMLRGFGDAELLFPGFLNLALAGILLGLAYQWTGALYFPIGLHAGWIFWLKTYGFLSREGIDGGRWFWGTSKLIDGFLAQVVLFIMLGLLLRMRPQSKTD